MRLCHQLRARVLSPLTLVAFFMWMPQTAAAMANGGLLTFERGTPSKDVIWTDLVEGLALGIRKPGRDFFLTDGKLDTSDTLIEIWLTNASVRVLKWSNSRLGWSIDFSSPTFKPSAMEARMHIPMPELGKPLSLVPSESVRLQISVASAHWIWPRLKPGEYQFRVSYDPRRLQNIGIGGSGGNLTKPFDVPGFWLGKLTTPRLNVRLSTRRTGPD